MWHGMGILRGHNFGIGITLFISTIIAVNWSETEISAKVRTKQKTTVGVYVTIHKGV